MPEAKEQWIEITLTSPPELSDALSNFLIEMNTLGIIQEEGESDAFDQEESVAGLDELKAYLPAVPESKEKITLLQRYIDSLSELFPALEKPAFTTVTVVDPGWEEQWKKFFKPLRVSRGIVIKPTWERYAPAGRDIVVDIDPGMAFGTGQHPSTRMCIMALEEIITKDRTHGSWNVLDIGTGTGILAICCAKLGAEKVTAIDIDPRAVDIASKNVAINGVGDRVTVVNQDLETCDRMFDLIVANLTAATLTTYHAALIRMISGGGYFIASGIIDQDRDSIEEIFRTEDLDIHDICTEREWVCYVFHKRSMTD